jgi:hypothetical protein
MSAAVHRPTDCGPGLWGSAAYGPGPHAPHTPYTLRSRPALGRWTRWRLWPRTLPGLDHSAPASSDHENACTAPRCARMPRPSGLLRDTRVAERPPWHELRAPRPPSPPRSPSMPRTRGLPSDTQGCERRPRSRCDACRHHVDHSPFGCLRAPARGVRACRLIFHTAWAMSCRRTH